MLLALAPPAAPAQAAVVVVNSLADPNPATGSCPATCTLRNAIAFAGPGEPGGGIGAILGNITVSGSAITNNAADTAFGEGGGIAGLGTVIQIDRSTISGNTAVSGAGLYLGSASLTLTNSTVSGNTATNTGGALAAIAAPSNSNRTRRRASRTQVVRPSARMAPIRSS